MGSGDLPGMVAILMIFGIPMVAIMTKHQQKMAELLHRNAASSPETQALREEIRELKSLVHEQAIAIDNLARPLPSETRLQERVGA